MDATLLAGLPEEQRRLLEESIAAMRQTALQEARDEVREEQARRDEERAHAQQETRSSAVPSPEQFPQDARAQQQGRASGPPSGATRIRWASGQESGDDQLAGMEESWKRTRAEEAEAAFLEVKAVRDRKLTGAQLGNFTPEQLRFYVDYELMAFDEYDRVYEEITKTMNVVLAVQAKALTERREKELAECSHPPPNDLIASDDRRHEKPDISNSGYSRQEPLQAGRIERQEEQRNSSPPPPSSPPSSPPPPPPPSSPPPLPPPPPPRHAEKEIEENENEPEQQGEEQGVAEKPHEGKVAEKPHQGKEPEQQGEVQGVAEKLEQREEQGAVDKHTEPQSPSPSPSLPAPPPHPPPPSLQAKENEQEEEVKQGGGNKRRMADGGARVKGSGEDHGRRRRSRPKREREREKEKDIIIMGFWHAA